MTNKAFLVDANGQVLKATGKTLDSATGLDSLATLTAAQGAAGGTNVPAMDSTGAMIDATGAQWNQSVVSLTAPAAFGWNAATYPFTVSLYQSMRGRNVAASAAVDTFLTTHFADCLAATPIYVDVTSGNDTTGAGTVGNPYKTINKGMLIANASAVASHIKILGGTGREYALTDGFNGSSTQPTVRTVFTAYSGRVRATTRYQPTWSGSTDATYTNCYTAAIATTNIGRMVSRRMLKPFSPEYADALRLDTPTLVNAQPGTYCTSGTNLYYNPTDGKAPTNTNTYVYQAGTGNLRAAAATPVSIWVRGLNGGDGFDFEGGSTGCARFNYSAVPGTPIVIAMDDCTMRYAGTTTGATNVGVASRQMTVDGLHGIFIGRNCHAGSAGDDLWNIHNTLSGSGAVTYGFTLNCTGDNYGYYDPTQTQVQSINCLTTHENVIWWDVAGHYRNSLGRTVFSINTTKTLLMGTIAESSFGDTLNGGGYIPSEFGVANTGEMWLDRCEARSAAAGTPALSVDDTAKMHLRNVWPRGNKSQVATGATLDTY